MSTTTKHMLSRLCGVCMSGDQAGLSNCGSCHGVAWCREGGCRGEDQDLHLLACQALHHTLQDEVQGRQGHALACYMPVPQPHFSPLPASLPALLAEGVHHLLPPGASREVSESELRRLSLTYTCPTTVLWGAQVAGLSLATMTSLVVHVVGANVTEMMGLIKWEYLLHRWDIES